MRKWLLLAVLSLPAQAPPTNVHVNAALAHPCTVTSDGSQADTQSKVTAATAGQTVCVPAISTSWATPVSVSGKALTLQGAGIGSTNITCTGTGECLAVTASATNFVSVTGFTFIESATNSDGLVQLVGTDVHGASSGVGFRFHHNRLFDNGVAGGRGMSIFAVWGLIDHVTFDVTATGGTHQSVAIYGSVNGSDQGFTPWQTALSLGTGNAVYVEDSAFNYSNANDTAIDSYDGARVVIRHNTETGNHLGDHGTDSGQSRGTLSVELYANTLTNNFGSTPYIFQHRGGVLVAFDNTLNGSNAWGDFLMSLYRECPLDSSNYSSWQPADGTQLGVGSTSFSSAGASCAGLAGSAISCSGFSGTANVIWRHNNREAECTIGSGSNSDGACDTYLDGSGTGGYPGRDQPGVQPGQTVYGLYQWNNGTHVFTQDGARPTCNAGLSNTNWLTANRDFFDYVSSGFDGTVGVGRGINASKPGTCTTGVGYFSTDAGTQGTLYRCTATNTWTASYTPYTYPHPLQTP